MKRVRLGRIRGAPARVRIFDLLQVYRVFGRHYRRQIGTLAGSMAGLVFTVAIALVTPWPLKLIIDHVVLQTPLPASVRWLERWVGSAPLALLGVLVAAFIVLRVLDSLATYLHKVGLETAWERMAREIRNRVFERLQRLSLAFHGSSRTGDLILRLESDITYLKIVLLEVPNAFGYRTLMVFTHVGLMLWLNWRVALIAFAIVPILFFYNRQVGRAVQQASQDKRARESDVAALVWENVTAMALVQAYGREDLQQKRFTTENRQSLASGLRAMWLSKVFKRTTDLLVAAGTCGVVWYGGTLALRGEILPGTVVLFVSYLHNLYSPIDKFASMLLDVATAQAAADRVVEVVESEDEIRDRPGARPAGRVRGAVALENVAFAYRPGVDVLRDVSFVVEPGQRVAVVGRNGSGKSTLLGLLLRFRDPRVGCVRIDGEDVRGFTVESLRSNITVVLQEAKLFRRPVDENIAFGRPSASAEEIVNAARLAEAHDFIQRMPHGYRTMIEEGGDNLSGGERQRIHIARAMIRDTPIMILDEPSTALDARTEARVRNALDHLTRGKTTLIVAHRLSTIIGADRILFLDDGRLDGFGTHDELLATRPRYRSLYESQFGVATAATGEHPAVASGGGGSGTWEGSPA